MLGSKLILALAMIGQPPAAVGPAYPQAVVSKPGDVSKRWLDSTSPIDGHPIRILGWIEDGTVRFDPRDYPQFVPATTPAKNPGSSATNPPKTSPTGVVFAKFPTITAGHSWNGGNVTGPIVGEVEPPEAKQPPEVYVTIIGAKRDRERVKNHLARDPSFVALSQEMGPRLAVEAYDPANPLVADVGLAAGGKPDIVVLDSTGLEVERFAQDADPALIVKAIRKADPAYRAKSPAHHPSEGPGLAWALVAIGAFFFIAKAGTTRR